MVDPQPLLSGHGGRREWFRAGRRQLEDHRALQRRPVARDRDDRLFDAAGRLEKNHEVDLAANELYERWRPGLRTVGPQVARNRHEAICAAGAAGGDDQSLRPGLASDAHPGHPAPPGLQRAGRGQRPADHPRGRGHRLRRGLRAPGADARHHASSLRRAGVSEQPDVLLG